MTDLNQTYRLIALLMALLIFITSVSFTIDMHYCKDELKSVNFFGKAKSCHEIVEGTVKKICPHHQKMMEQSDNCSMDKKDCCENKTYHVQADDSQQIKIDNFVESLPLQRALVAQVFQLFKQQSFENDTPNFKHYQPPLIPRDIPVLVQSFLL